MSDFELIKSEVSEKIRINFQPCLNLSTVGDSYLNKKAASLLDLKPGDVLAFYHNNKKDKWFLCNDIRSGALIRHKGSLYKFCDTKRAKEIFTALEISGKKAFFPLADRLEEKEGLTVLFIIPKPFNIA